VLIIWIGFLVLILLLLALDLGVFHRRARAVSIREALVWTCVWVILSLLFNVLVYYLYDRHWLGVGLQVGHELSGTEGALQFFTGYLLEKCLSVDNIFVIAMIFAYFSVPLAYQHRVLFWGILGALVMRGIMIAAGTALIRRIEWIVYVFGGLLILTAVKMLITRHDNIAPDKNPLVRLARRFYPVTPGFEGPKFFVRMDGRLAITPLLLVLIVIETTDLLFAVDSIPAILAITHDPFLVFTSNVFAILGLRSLYFALAGMMHKFQYLKMSLVFLLAFVGVKMLISHHYPIPIHVSLAIIGGILLVGILGSLVGARRDTAPLASPLPEEVMNFGEIAWRNIRRVVILIVGGCVVLMGIVLIVTPGPAILVIPLGLAILATEFSWPKRLLAKVRETIRRRRSRRANPHNQEDSP